LQRHGGPDLATVAVPWSLKASEIEAVLAEEEPDADPGQLFGARQARWRSDRP
jgi:hypothetical protein